MNSGHLFDVAAIMQGLTVHTLRVWEPGVLGGVVPREWTGLGLEHLGAGSGFALHTPYCV